MNQNILWVSDLHHSASSNSTFGFYGKVPLNSQFCCFPPKLQIQYWFVAQKYLIYFIVEVFVSVAPTKTNLFRWSKRNETLSLVRKVDFLFVKIYFSGNSKVLRYPVLKQFAAFGTGCPILYIYIMGHFFIVEFPHEYGMQIHNIKNEKCWHKFNRTH